MFITTGLGGQVLSFRTLLPCHSLAGCIGEVEPVPNSGGNMKFTRLITFIMVIVMACTVWTPAPAFAKQLSTGASLTAQAKAKPKSKAKVSKFTTIKWKNMTGGVMTLTLISLDGKNPNYTFSVGNNAVSNFVFNAGYYSYTVTSTACIEPWSGRARYAAKKISSPIYMCANYWYPMHNKDKK
jgi:hypothetical protein